MFVMGIEGNEGIEGNLSVNMRVNCTHFNSMCAAICNRFFLLVFLYSMAALFRRNIIKDLFWNI